MATLGALRRLGLLAVGAGAAWAGTTAGAPPIRFRNTEPGVAYRGSKSCGQARCHDQLSRDFARTPMGGSTRPANNPEDLARVPEKITIFVPEFDRYFEVYREGNDLFQSEYQLEAGKRVVFKTTHKLEYSVGGGLNGFTYLIRRGDSLFEAPLSYYVKPGKWDLSPGYVAADMGFSRPALAGCMVCHTGLPRAVKNREARYENPPFQFDDMAIACERCHGPGELHEREVRAGKAKVPDTSIVNPVRLAARLADDVCMNCHQGGHTRVLQPGKDYMDFRPGLPLNHVAAIFKAPLKPEEREEADKALTQAPVRGSLEMPAWWKNSSMEMSKCYLASGGKMRCVTCHTIHRPPTEGTRAAHYREKCLTCHTNKSCSIPLAQRVRQTPSNDCAGCHMPKRPVAGIAHSEGTNHRIMRRPGQPLPDAAFQERTDLPGLVYVNAPASGDRSVPALTRLAAYGEAMKARPELAELYLKTLDEVSRSNPDDPLVLAALGRKALFDKDYPKAIEFLTRARERGSEATTTFLDLGDALAAAGKTEQSVEVLQRGIEISPYAQVLHKSLTLNYITLKQYGRAHEALKRYVELFPEDSFMRGLLEKAEQGRPGSSGGR